MTITRQQLVEQARTWLGTPWAHQGRAKGVGVDCVGLFACSLAELGEPAGDFTWYRRAPEGDSLIRELDKRFVRLAKEEPGALLIFYMETRRIPQHIGLLTFDGTIIHSNAAAGVAFEQAYDRTWRERAIGAFDLTQRVT